MNNFPKTLLLLALIFSACIGQEAIPEMPIGRSTRGEATKTENFRDIRLLRVNRIQTGYLFFVVEHVEDNSNELIRMAIFRNDEEEPIVKCESKNIDACFITSDLVKENDVLVAAIQCKEDCRYSLQTYWGNIENLVLDQIQKFVLAGNRQTQLFHLDLSGKEFKEARVILVPETMRAPGDSVKLYGNFGFDKAPTLENHDFESQNLWKDGQGLFFSGEDLKNQKQLFLLAVGQTETLYAMKAEIIQSEKFEIKEKTKIYEYVQKNSEKAYHLQLESDEETDEYSLHFSKFSGAITISFYTDKEMTTPYTPKSFEYMNDIKYMILKEQAKKDELTEVYIKVKTTETNSVFMIIYDKRRTNGAVQIIETVYDFLPVHDKKIIYMHFEEFSTQTHKQMNEIDINLIRVVGDIDASFRICKGQIEKCFDLNSYTEQSRELSPVDHTLIGMKSSFKLKVDPRDFQEINGVESSCIILIVITNQLETPSLVAAEFSLGDGMQDLRQGHPIESMVDTGETKLYKFLNSDPAVKAVRIHVSPVRGQLDAKGSRLDPRKTIGQITESVGHQITFLDNLNDAMYVSVTGLTPAVYSITVQLKHEEIAFSSMSLSENIEYTIRIPPKGAEVVRLHPIFSSLYFNYRSTSEVMTCFLDKDDICQNTEHPNISKKGEISVKENKDRTNNIVIGNPSDSMFVEVKMIYHSADYNHCEERTMEEFYTENIEHEACFDFPLREPLETVTFLVQRNDIGPLGVDAYACGQPIKGDSFLPKFEVTADDIIKKCAGKSPGERALALIFQGDPENKDEIMKVQFSGLYRSSVVNLADGVAFRVNGMSTEGKLSTYYYHAINIIQTTILLRSYRGNYKFYAKIIDSKEKRSAHVNSQDYDFYSHFSNFFRNPALVLSKQNFENSNCNECAIIVAIYSEEDIGGLIQYSIEAVQNEMVLKDNQNYENHLFEGSVAFYEYEAHKEECNLIVQISDHNKDCAQIYLSDSENPSETNNLVKELGTKLTYSACSKGIYYIAVEAVKDCAYSISVSNSEYSITKISRGKPSNIKLAEGEVKYFIFRHIAEMGFKLATLNRFGSVYIYVNTLDIEHLDLLKSGKHLDYENFKFSSSYTDVLSIETTEQGFCSNCYYIVAVIAKRQTQSSLLLADSETPIAMTSGKIFNDELLEKGEVTDMTFTKILAGILPLQVHSGTVKATIKYKKQSIDYTFQKKNELQLFKFKLVAGDNGAYDWSPIKLQMSCIEPKCVYSMGLVDITNDETKANDVKIVPGRPSYILLKPNMDVCFSGFIKEKEDDIVVTVDRDNTDYLQNLQIKFTIDGKDTNKFSKNTIRNVMSISADYESLSLSSTVPYRICMNLHEDMSISSIIEQGEDINLLPEDSEVIVQEESTFLVYPEGPFIVDIFECSGETSFTHGFDEDELDNVEMSALSNVGMPDQPHAIKITSFLPTFLRIKSALSIVRWLPINEIEERGLGYFTYKIGDLKYETEQNQIQVIYDSVKNIKETKTIVKGITYKLYISDNVDSLKSAASCEKFLPENVIVIELNVPDSQMVDSDLTYSISKDVIGKKFRGRKDNIYMNMVADMTLKVPEHVSSPSNQGQPDEEYYRFMYHSQQIPKDVFIGHQGSIFEQTIVIVAVGSAAFLAFVVICYLVLKKIMPIVSRMRSQMMLEDQVSDKDAEKQQDMKIDPVIQSNQRIVIDDS